MYLQHKLNKKEESLLRFLLSHYTKVNINTLDIAESINKYWMNPDAPLLSSFRTESAENKLKLDVMNYPQLYKIAEELNIINNVKPFNVLNFYFTDLVSVCKVMARPSEKSKALVTCRMPFGDFSMVVYKDREIRSRIHMNGKYYIANGNSFMKFLTTFFDTHYDSSLTVDEDLYRFFLAMVAISLDKTFSIGVDIFGEVPQLSYPVFQNGSAVRLLYPVNELLQHRYGQEEFVPVEIRFHDMFVEVIINNNKKLLVMLDGETNPQVVSLYLRIILGANHIYLNDKVRSLLPRTMQMVEVESLFSMFAD